MGTTGDLFATEVANGVDAQAASLNRIRVETAFSRYPLHRLAKKEVVDISLQQTARNGDPEFRWDVTYVQKYGQPGPLAYKVDTLIVNRRIDEAGRPLPKIIRLGSLTQICSELGIGDSGENRQNVRRALHQNASAYITAKIRFRTRTGKSPWREIGYSRYSVVFTGDVMPDGSMADAVYIVPNASYRDLLNQAERRPLDYDYLKSLTPGAQRFYELISFQIYGALASGRLRAKMLYSDYCMYAPQNRYFEFDKVKKQMFKIHAPHRDAGYIGYVDYQQVIEEGGEADWEIFYTPGKKAVAEYQTFTRRQVRQTVEHTQLPEPAAASSRGKVASEISEWEGGLLDQLIRRGIAQNTASDLLANVQLGQEVLDQLEYVDQLVAKDSRGKLTNPPGLYITYVRDNVTPPADFVGSRKRGLIEKAHQEKHSKAVEREKQKLEYKKLCDEATNRYIAEELPSEEYAAMLRKHRLQIRQLFTGKSNAELDELSALTVRDEIKNSGNVPMPILAASEE